MTAVQQSLRTFIAAIFAFIVYRYFKLPEGYWIVLSSLLLIQLRLNFFFWKNLLFIFLCGILILANVFFVNWTAERYYYSAIYLFITTFIGVYIGLVEAAFFLPAFFINFCGGISAGVNVLGHDAWMRINNIVIGVIIASLVSIVMWPPRLKRDVKQHISEILQVLNQLQKKTFLIYRNRDYFEKQFLYEKELHKLRVRIFNIMQNIHSVIPSKVALPSLVDNLNQLIELIIMLGNLRYRVKDQTIFEVCEKNFNDVSKKLSEALMTGNVSDLQSSIQALEGVYRNTLEIVSKEPVDFLIFIQNLTTINDVMNSLQVEIAKI